MGKHASHWRWKCAERNRPPSALPRCPTLLTSGCFHTVLLAARLIQQDASDIVETTPYDGRGAAFHKGEHIFFIWGGSAGFAIRVKSLILDAASEGGSCPQSSGFSTLTMCIEMPLTHLNPESLLQLVFGLWLCIDRTLTHRNTSKAKLYAVLQEHKLLSLYHRAT